jgi:cobalamin synthase
LGGTGIDGRMVEASGRSRMLGKDERTGVGGLVRVLLALVEAVLLLLLLNGRVADGALVIRLVDSRVSDV